MNAAPSVNFADLIPDVVSVASEQPTLSSAAPPLCTEDVLVEVILPTTYRFSYKLRVPWLKKYIELKINIRTRHLIIIIIIIIK